jgi:hypothetical protein
VRASEEREYLTNDNALGKLDVQVREPELLEVVHHRYDVAISLSEGLKLHVCGRA